MVVLECCVDSVASARAAQEGGADRLELCAALAVGGLTPSHGLITRVLSMAGSLPVLVLVRPRGGDFCYSTEELEVMAEDVRSAVALGAHGIVTGALEADGGMDVAAMTRLVACAGPVPVTFHRAIDVCSDALRAVEDCAAVGVRRILTSGQAATALAGASAIRDMVTAAGPHGIAVVAGGGVSEANVRALAEECGASEFHGSFTSPLSSRVCHRPAEHVPMASAAAMAALQSGTVLQADVERIRAVKSLLAELQPRSGVQ